MPTLTNKMNYEELFKDIFDLILSKKNLHSVPVIAAQTIDLKSSLFIYYNPGLNLAAGQYLIMLEEARYKTNLLDIYIDKYKEWIGQSEADVLYMSNELINSRTHLKESYKLRMLNTAYINKLQAEGIVTDNFKDAKNRLNVVLHLEELYYEILKNSKYKSTIKYIEQLPKLTVETFNQYTQYILKSDTNFMVSKVEEYNLFIYNLLFTFIGQQKANKVVEECHELVCKTEFFHKDIDSAVEHFKRDVDVILSLKSLGELIDFHMISRNVHASFKELVTSKEALYEAIKEKDRNNKSRITKSRSIKNTLNYKHDTVSKRTIFLLESLINGIYLTGDEINKLSSSSKYKQWLKKSGFINGEINALVLLEKLNSFMEPYFKSYLNLESEAPIVDMGYVNSQLMLSYFDMDLIYTLNDLTLTIEDLEAFTDIFTLNHDFESSWFRVNLSLVDKEVTTIELDIKDAFEFDEWEEYELDKIEIVKALIQFCLYKHMNQLAEGQFQYVARSIMSKTSSVDNTSCEEVQKLNEVNERQKNEINDLKQQLRQAQLSLHNQNLAHTNEIQSYKEQVREMKEQFEMDKELDMAELELEGIKIRELTDQIEEEISDVHDDKDYIELIKELNVAVIGGHNNLHTNLRNSFSNKNLILIAPRNYTTPIKVINKADVIVFIDSHNNHGQFRRVVAHLRKSDSKYKMFYSNTQPQPKVLAKAVYEHFVSTINA
ncbi:hypothetical protein [Solibacillus sp. NPDC093137]|uniref:hypothetical protein n=1 Tax=Solibacillus sp. NPDC093137 TaxID=3390678 RepID=UPI003D023712